MRFCSKTGEEMDEGWYFENSGMYFKYEEDVVAYLMEDFNTLTAEYLDGDYDEELGLRLQFNTQTNDDILTMAYDCEWMYWTTWHEETD